MRRLKNAIIPMLLLIGLMWGLCPSMLAVRTAHADQADTGSETVDMEKSGVPQPASDDDDTESEPMPLSDADVAVQTSQVPDDAIASGTAGTCLFYITPDLEMVVTPADGTSGVLPEGSKNSDWPWYRYAAYIKTVRFDKGVKTGKTLEWAFSNGSEDANAYNRLESVDFTNLDATSLTSMKGILAYDATLTSVNLNMLNAVQIKYLNEAFRATGLATLDLTPIGDKNLWTIDNMCNSCMRLETVRTGWTLPVLYYAQGTFGEDANLTDIDAGGWRFGKAGSLSLMFKGCSSLKALDVSRWDMGTVFVLYWTFGSCTGLKTLDVSGWNTGSLRDARGIFSNCTGLETLDVSGWNTGKTTSFEQTFNNCKNLTALDVSKWDTGKATSMRNMFSGDAKLTVLDVSKWDTSNVTDMTYLFNQCTGLATLDVSGWNTGKATSMYGMFRLTNLATVDVSRWDVSHVGSAASMFYGCSKLAMLDIADWRLTSLWAAYNMFHGCKKLTRLDVSRWGMGNVMDMTEMFSNCNGLAALDGLAEWDTGKTIKMSGMFSGCSKLTDVDIASWDVRKVTTTESMLRGTPITRLDLSAWNTDSLTNMRYMFENMQRLTSLSMDGWNTSNVTDMSGLFGHDQKLTDLGVDGWDTGNVRLMGHMFEYCTKLSTLDLTGWNTANVTSMYGLFDNCTSLTSLKLGDGWDMGNVTDTTWMFSADRKLASTITRIVPDWTMGNVRKTAGMFSSCVDGVLDLSKWNTPLLTDTRYMFQYNPNLTRILVNENWSNITFTDNSTDMFAGCVRLVGDDGKGLAYNPTKTDGEYAMPDTGYMTLKAIGDKTMHAVTYLDWNGNAITTRRVKDGTSGENIGMYDTTWLADPNMYFNTDRWNNSTFTEKGKKQAIRDSYARAVDRPVNNGDAIHVTGRADYTQAKAGGVFGWRALYTAGGNSNWSGYLCRKDEQCVADQYYTFDGTASILPFTQIDLWDDYGTAYVSAMQLTQVDPITHNSLARDGYTFTGWSKDVSHVTGDMTVQAQYEPVRYTVNYDANGGTGSMPASTLTYDSPQALSAIGFTKAGYSFTGWNTRKDGSGRTFTDKQTVSNLLTHEGASGTLYAQWTPTPPIVTVIFHVNNGGADETVKRVWASNNLEMKTIGLPSGWSNSGFAFRGWNLKDDGTGVEYEVGETLYGRLTAETTDLYADWNGLQTRLPDTGGILKRSLAGLLLAGGGLALWTVGRRRRGQA